MDLFAFEYLNILSGKTPRDVETKAIYPDFQIDTQEYKSEPSANNYGLHIIITSLFNGFRLTQWYDIDEINRPYTDPFKIAEILYDKLVKSTYGLKVQPIKAIIYLPTKDSNYEF